MSTQSLIPSLAAVSEQVTALVSSIAAQVVTVHGRERGSSSGIVWRSGLVVTAEETVEIDQSLSITRSDGTRMPATLVGRDPSTDIALLRTEEPLGEGAPLGSTTAIQVGHLAIAVGRRHEGLSAALGIVALAGGAWQSLRGGQIDRLLQLDLRLDLRSEGGAVLDAEGHIMGMTVFGPRGRVLVIPSETIERVAQHLLEHGRMARGYLGLGLQPVRIDPAIVQAASLAEPAGLMVINVDRDGPGHAAEVRQGDVLLTWDAHPLRSVRSLYGLLGSESVGQSVELRVLRAGELMTKVVQVQERPQPE